MRVRGVQFSITYLVAPIRKLCLSASRFGFARPASGENKRLTNVPFQSRELFLLSASPKSRASPAIVKPLSVAEMLDIAELRLALISLALKPAYRHLSTADFDRAYDLAKRITRSNNSRDHFEYHSQFWDGLFSKTQRPNGAV